MTKFVSLLILGLGFVWLSACNAQQANSSTIERLEPVAFVEAINDSDSDSYVIDCRTPNEYANGSLTGAQNLDYRSSNFRQLVEALDTTKTVFVFCQAGGRSAAAAKVFSEKGFDKILDMQGGYSAFKANGVKQPRNRN